MPVSSPALRLRVSDGQAEEEHRDGKRRYHRRRCSGNSLVGGLEVEGHSVRSIPRDIYCGSIWKKCGSELTKYTGGGIFDTGPGFVFNMGGGPGIRVHQFGGGRPRRRPDTAQGAGQEQPASISSALSSLLPLILLFILPLLSSLLSGSSTPSGPSVVFESKPPNTQQRTTSRFKVQYYVNPTEVDQFTKQKWRKLDEQTEQKYMEILNLKCEYEHQQQQQVMQDAQGWFFIDQEKMDSARKMQKPSCQRLREFGLRY